jgi:hypothetical protein
MPVDFLKKVAIKMIQVRKAGKGRRSYADESLP